MPYLLKELQKLSPIFLAISSLFESAKIDGPDPEIPQPKAPDSNAEFFKFS